MDWMEKQRLIDACSWAPETRGTHARREVRFRLLHWCSTSPHPTRPAHTGGADAGQLGWRLHLVMGRPDKLGSRWASERPRSICGADAKHGWGMDLFIDELCVRCLRTSIKRGLTLPSPPR